jgi:hypothetical protein
MLGRLSGKQCSATVGPRQSETNKQDYTTNLNPEQGASRGGSGPASQEETSRSMSPSALRPSLRGVRGVAASSASDGNAQEGAASFWATPIKRKQIGRATPSTGLCGLAAERGERTG